MAFDPYALPPDLLAPVDDGGADHLPGSAIPEVRLDSSQGPVDSPSSPLSGSSSTYRAGNPGSRSAEEWDAYPGAGAVRSAVASATTRRTLARRAGNGLSAQTLPEQVEFAGQTHMPYPWLPIRS
jgi:hypothetical protein